MKSGRVLDVPIEQRDWQIWQTRVFGIPYSELVFRPIYHGNNFEKACAAAEEFKACVWESKGRDTWMVSWTRPPFALSKPEADRDMSWTLCGDARRECDK